MNNTNNGHIEEVNTGECRCELCKSSEKVKQVARLSQVYNTLQVIIENWDNDDIINYPQSLPSLDELAEEIGAIDLKTK